MGNILTGKKIVVMGVANKHSIAWGWSPVNKIDNLNRDFFVLCHD